MTVKPDLNQHFNPIPHMDRATFAILVGTQRLWMTRACFTGPVAEIVMGPAPAGFHYPMARTYYRGYLITENSKDLEEAKKVAVSRGMNESVVWIVEDSSPLGEPPTNFILN